MIGCVWSHRESGIGKHEALIKEKETSFYPARSPCKIPPFYVWGSFFGE
jgi:hypothetical protein